MSMFVTERALAAFLRANSLILIPLACSVRKSLVTRWEKPETRRGELLGRGLWSSSNLLV